MTRRYFAPKLPARGGVVSLDESEAHHAVNVMRIRAGESIVLFDGAGREAEAIVQSVGRREVVCDSAPTSMTCLENNIHMTAAIAMPKGDRAKELVERLTELGVNRLVPLHCKRTQWPVSENTVQKWHRLVIDACKQSGRNQLMEIASPHGCSDWLVSVQPPGAAKWIAHPMAADTPLAIPSPLQTDPVHRVMIAIGPEGGFSEEEVALADEKGWQRLSLGRRIYRIETAAILSVIKLAQL